MKKEDDAFHISDYFNSPPVDQQFGAISRTVITVTESAHNIYRVNLQSRIVLAPFSDPSVRVEESKD